MHRYPANHAASRQESRPTGNSNCIPGAETPDASRGNSRSRFRCSKCAPQSPERAPTAMAVEAVNEVKIARTATPGTNRKLAGHVRVGAGDKGRHFLVADQN